jgi:FMN reductase
MKMILLSGSNVGTKTRTVIDHLAEAVTAYDPTIELSVIDLAEVDMKSSPTVGTSPSTPVIPVG